MMRAVVNTVNIIWSYKSGSFSEQINDHGILKEDNLSVFMYKPICMCSLMCIKSAFDVF